MSTIRQRGRSVPRAMVLAFLAALVPVSGAVGHLVMPWYSTTESAYIYSSETTWTTGDSIRTRVTAMDWSSTAATNMRHVATHGARFTLNFADLSNNLSATTRHTTDMPNPYFDRDLSGSKCGEAEITSESSSFPSSTSVYFGNYWFTRWYWIGGGTGWAWNNAGGTIEYGEQLSEQYWWTSDKWDAASPTYGGNAIAFIANMNYPSRARPSSNPPASADPCQYDDEPLDGFAMAAEPAPEALAEPAPEALAEGFDVLTGDEVGEVRVKADLSRGLANFASKTRDLARALAGRGSATGMLTFTRPVGRAVVEQLIDMGINIHTVEAVSAEMPSGNRLTFGDAYGPNFWNTMSAVATDERADMLGITSAVVTVPNLGAYLRASANENVFVIDLAAEQVRRSDRQIVDVVMNDVYWYVAGWETP